MKTIWKLYEPDWKNVDGILHVIGMKCVYTSEEKETLEDARNTWFATNDHCGIAPPVAQNIQGDTFDCWTEQKVSDYTKIRYFQDQINQGPPIIFDF